MGWMIDKPYVKRIVTRCHTMSQGYYIFFIMYLCAEYCTCNVYPDQFWHIMEVTGRPQLATQGLASTPLPTPKEGGTDTTWGSAKQAIVGSIWKFVTGSANLVALAKNMSFVSPQEIDHPKQSPPTKKVIFHSHSWP